MNVIIGCSRNKYDKIGSVLIQKKLRKPYSHVYARWYLAEQERTIVFHAANGMVHQIELNNFLNDNIIVEEFSIDLSKEQFRKFSQKCIDLCAVAYSNLELLQIFLSDITGGKIKFTDQKGYICSELVAELLEDLGYTFEKPKHLLTPKDIIEKLRS